MRIFLFFAASIMALGQVPAVNSGTATYPTSGTICTTATCAGSPAGSAVKDHQCWATSSTFGVCAPQYTTVSFSATPTFTAADSYLSAWTETLTNNVTSSTLSGPTTGQKLLFKICQDGTGGRTFVWPTGFSSAAAVSPIASACTTEEFTWDGSSAILQSAFVDSGSGYHSEIAAPSGNPASGFQFSWFDSTDHTLEVKNSSGTTYKLGLTVPAQYKTLTCQAGLGDGLNAMAAGTYLQSTCWNKTGVTVTLTGIQCFTDNAGSSTLAPTNGAGTALLTGAVTCSSTIASGTQSATTTIASNDFIKFTFVADGTSKQTTWVIAGTY